MEPISYPCLVMASIVIYVGFYHFFMFIKRRKSIEHLAFSLLCFCVGLYDIFSIGLYNSHSIETGVFWQRLQLDIVYLISVFVIWFIRLFTGQKKNRITLFFIVWFIGLLFLTFVVSPEYTVSVSKPAIKNIDFANLIKITYYEGEVGLLSLAGIISSIIAYIYLFTILSRNYFKTKNKYVILIIVSQLAYFLGVINDSLIASRVYSFIYMSEYAFLVIIFAMSYVLLNDFVNLYTSIEDLNYNLERIIDERMLEIKRLNADLKRQAEIDALTGIYNRRFFNEYFEIEVKRARNQLERGILNNRTGVDMNFGVAIADIDNFKRINDTYGHPMGDKVLVEVVDEIKKNIFTRDIFCRYGGEEFVIIFTRTSKEGIIYAIEKIRKSIEEHEFVITEKTTEHRVTISIGAVVFQDVIDKDGHVILKLADDRLLVAKNTGKNRVVYE